MDELTRELGAATWIKSSYSGSNGGNCVEVATLSSGHRGVRDSKDPAGPALVFTPAEWNTFIRGIRGGEFD
ncbi:transcriptional regulator [Streptosporangium violaceochromogenes]|nr:transcriptional regulator [Streptosporangium violaceochromogenes]